jgi:hypothetical protein
MFSLLFSLRRWKARHDDRTIELEERENDENDESPPFDQT